MFISFAFYVLHFESYLDGDAIVILPQGNSFTREEMSIHRAGFESTTPEYVIFEYNYEMSYVASI
jgi:hypothetical protein